MAVVPRRRRGRGGRSLGPQPKGVASDGGNCHSARPLELWRFNLSANESGVEKEHCPVFFRALGLWTFHHPFPMFVSEKVWRGGF